MNNYSVYRYESKLWLKPRKPQCQRFEKCTELLNFSIVKNSSRSSICIVVHEISVTEGSYANWGPLESQF